MYLLSMKKSPVLLGQPNAYVHISLSQYRKPLSGFYKTWQFYIFNEIKSGCKCIN